RGLRVKLIAAARRDGDGVRAEARLREVDPAGPFGSLDGPANALRFDTDLLGPVVVTQLEGSLTATAYALVSDLVTVVRRLRARAGRSAGGREDAGAGGSPRGRACARRRRAGRCRARGR